MTELEKAIYSYDEANEIYNCSTFGGNNNFFSVDGELAEEQAAKLGFQISGKCSGGTEYIFRWNMAHTRLIPYHVTMRRKTAENLYHGSLKYGSAKIMKEVFS